MGSRNEKVLVRAWRGNLLEVNPIINQISTLVLTNRTEALGSNHQFWLCAERTKKRKRK